MISLRSWLVAGALLASVATVSCRKDKSKAEEAPKSEPTPIPSGLVFNDFLPASGQATGLGVRDSGIEGGLAAVGLGAGAEAEEAAEGQLAVKVIDAGSEPRAVRKYTFVANRVDTRVLTIQQAVTQSAGDRTSPPQEVILKIFLDVVPKEVKPTGAAIELKVTKVELPGASPQIAQALAPLSGLTGRVDVTSNGLAGDVSFTASPQMRHQLAELVLQSLGQGIELLLAPLPTTAIGVGATWELGGKGEGEQGSKRFTLKEVSAEGGVVESEIELKVPKRAAQSPRGGTMFVEVEGKGKYTQHVKFNQLSPKAEGEQSIVEKIQLADSKGGGAQSLTQIQKLKQIVETPAK